MRRERAFGKGYLDRLCKYFHWVIIMSIKYEYEKKALIKQVLPQTYLTS